MTFRRHYLHWVLCNISYASQSMHWCGFFPPFICFEEEKVCSVEDEFKKFIMNLQWNYIEILKNQDR